MLQSTKHNVINSSRGFPEEQQTVTPNFSIAVLLAKHNYVLFEKWPSTFSCYRFLATTSQWTFLVDKRRSSLWRTIFTSSTWYGNICSGWGLVIKTSLPSYRSNTSWQFAKCYDLTQNRGLAKKSTPLSLHGKVSPVIQNYTEMNSDLSTCFAVFQMTKLFLDKLTPVLFRWAMAFDDNDLRYC